MANRQQELLRLEPPAGVHDDVVRPRVGRIDDEALHVAQVFARRAFHIQTIEIDAVVFQVVRVDVLESGAWVIHESSIRRGMRLLVWSKNQAPQ